MPLQATSGAASYDAFGGGTVAKIKYIEDYFSTFLYSGAGTTQVINNGIDLSTNGGLVWLKDRGNVGSHRLVDTVRGNRSTLFSESTSAAVTRSDDVSCDVSSFNTNGFTAGNFMNQASNNYVSWSWAKAPKFFDVVTYTGNGTARSIAHSLGSTPGCVIIKSTSGTGSWAVWHRSGTQQNRYSAFLNFTDAYSNQGSSYWGTPLTDAPDMNATTFSVGTVADVNSNGVSYVAYLFAHNAGGFGLTGTDNVISCGSYTGNGSANGPSINLGYEPQFVIIKHASGSNNWEMYDNMRGVATGGNDALLRPNTSGVEEKSDDILSFTSTGFQLTNIYSNTNGSGESYIYIAIRRGPMKVPTSGTSVLNITTSAGTSPAYVSSFPVDFAYRRQVTGTSDNYFHSRLIGAATLYPNYTSEENSDSNVTWAYQNGMFTSTGANANQYGWLMRRAPSFMDIVCYTGNGTAGRTITHNLAVAPELMLIKCRSTAHRWLVIKGTDSLNLSTTDAASSVGSAFATTSTYFTVSNGTNNNASGLTYVNYLFATCAGVSKVGSYTGNGSTQTIDCGFTGGARFVIIKRTDSTGGWYVYDTVRGMTVLTDPYVFLNDNAAQVATLGSVTTVSTGFALNSTILAAINVSAANYIFLAIA